MEQETEARKIEKRQNGYGITLEDCNRMSVVHEEVDGHYVYTWHYSNYGGGEGGEHSKLVAVVEGIKDPDKLALGILKAKLILDKDKLKQGPKTLKDYMLEGGAKGRTFQKTIAGSPIFIYTVLDFYDERDYPYDCVRIKAVAQKAYEGVEDASKTEASIKLLEHMDDLEFIVQKEDDLTEAVTEA